MASEPVFLFIALNKQSPGTPVKYISEEISSKIINHDLAYTAIKQALAAATLPESRSFKVVQGQGSDPVNSFGIKAAATDNLAGLKVGSFWIHNATKGLPRHNSLILLFDQSCGKIGVAIEAGRVNAFRTAAADAVATDLLARKEASILTVFGTGNQAYYECTAIARIRAIKQVIIVGRNEKRAQALADKLVVAGLSARTDNAENACRAADIIVTATSSKEPLFKACWVKPGSHISTMGADAAGKQELPTELYAIADLFCDLPEQSRLIGEFQHAPQHIQLTAIGNVINGQHSGRHSDSAITLFDSSGISVQDLYIGHSILQAWETTHPNTP